MVSPQGDTIAKKNKQGKRRERTFLVLYPLSYLVMCISEVTRAGFEPATPRLVVEVTLFYGTCYGLIC
jgi:hypothetical protein